MSTAPAFASASQALEAACAALRFAAAADPAAMPDAVKAECLHSYESAAAMLTAGPPRCPSAPAKYSRSMQTRNAASVLPEPVGAAISV